MKMKAVMLAATFLIVRYTIMLKMDIIFYVYSCYNLYCVHRILCSLRITRTTVTIVDNNFDNNYCRSYYLKNFL